MCFCGMASPFCKLGISFERANGKRRPLFLACTYKNQTKFEKRLFFWSSPNFGQKIGLNLSEDLFFGLHLILGEKAD